MPEDKNAREEGQRQDPYVEKHRPDPSSPPVRTLTLTGFSGRSDRAGYRRLYLTTDLDQYLEFREEDVVAEERIAAEEPEMPGEEATRIRIRRDAVIDQISSRPGSSVDEFDLDLTRGGGAGTQGPATVFGPAPGPPTLQTCLLPGCGNATLVTCLPRCNTVTLGNTCNLVRCGTLTELTCITCNQVRCGTLTVLNTCDFAGCGHLTQVTCNTCSPVRCGTVTLGRTCFCPPVTEVCPPFQTLACGGDFPGQGWNG
jgi:hypothetical protein